MRPVQSLPVVRLGATGTTRLEQIEQRRARAGKVVAAVTPACSRIATALYATAIDPIIPVSSTQLAEMVKLLENTFRAVNIGVVKTSLIVDTRHALGGNVGPHVFCLGAPSQGRLRSPVEAA